MCVWGRSGLKRVTSSLPNGERVSTKFSGKRFQAGSVEMPITKVGC